MHVEYIKDMNDGVLAYGAPVRVREVVVPAVIPLLLYGPVERSWNRTDIFSLLIYNVQVTNHGSLTYNAFASR